MGHNLKYLILLLIAIPFAIGYDGSIQLQCQSVANFNIGEKQYCLGILPPAFSNEQFKCLSYIELNSEILQTNPQYTERAQSFFSLTGTEQDTRQYFEPANTVVNFYYTQKNLHTKTNYTINLICNSANSSLHGDTTVQVDYENLEFVFSRTDWGMRNAPYIIGGALLIIIVLGVFLMWWKAVTK
jgi:hypothetical protein